MFFLMRNKTCLKSWNVLNKLILQISITHFEFILSFALHHSLAGQRCKFCLLFAGVGAAADVGSPELLLDLCSDL